MTISYNWLKEYIDIDLTAQEVADILTSIGLEVEGLEKRETIKGGLEGVVVAEVLTCEKHPNADKLSLTTVSVGGEPIQVVCGAPNVAAGQKVVLATEGATLYPYGEEKGFTIKKSKIRGEESIGMICSEVEIGISNEGAGIIVLPEDTVVGTPASEIYDISSDYIFEIGLTPNRSDATSHFGVARDLGVYLNKKAILPSVEDFKADNNSRPVKVVVEDSELAPRYMGITVSGLTIKPSPKWLQERLMAIGINPKNNVVDATNFILHECGHPLHAFDLSTIEADTIIVKRASKDEPFTTLDEVERKLSDEDLMICNASKPMCIAGVFGGLNSGVEDSTTAVFIESAYFNPVTVRRSAKRHGLSTDSSFRFERGADPNMAPYALKRAALLIKELAGGEISSDVVDIYPKPIESHEIKINYTRMNNLIGKEIAREKVDQILAALEIETVDKVGDSATVKVPPYRFDVRTEADVVEDILRIYGYNNVENPPYIKNVITAGNKQTSERLVETLSNMLSSIGFTEIMSNSLTKESYYKDLNSYKLENCVSILNPLSQELNLMRQTLLFNALEAVQLNSNRKNQDLLLYEIGKCYDFDPKANEKTLKAYREEKLLSLVATGMEIRTSWQDKGIKASLYSVKSAVEKIFERLGLNFYEGQMQPFSNELYSEGVTYTMRGKELFHMGVVSRSTLSKFDLKSAVYYVELNLDILQSIVNSVNIKAQELSKFQPVRRDLALLVKKDVTFVQLRDAASKAGGRFLTNVSLFDVYEGKNLPEHTKSYALNFTLESSEKTMNDKEIDQIMEKIAKALEKSTGAVIRSE